MKEPIRQLPKQWIGAKSDSSFSMRARNEREAISLFIRGKENLLNVNQWKTFAGQPSADFQLTDQLGHPATGLAQENAFIRIHLPLAAKNVFDWVRIETIEINENNPQKQWIMMTVRPVAAPGVTDPAEHFFAATATSNFIVQRENKKVTASIRGRNELPNTRHQRIFKKIRNAVIALLAMIGFSKPQWQALCKGILKTNL